MCVAMKVEPGVVASRAWSSLHHERNFQCLFQLSTAPSAHCGSACSKTWRCAACDPIRSTDHEALLPDRGEMAQEEASVGETGLGAEDATRPASCSSISRVRNNRRKSTPNTRTGRRKAGRDDIHRRPSSETPPPGTIMWTCGWWVIAEPQVWSTAVMPMRAPRCRGSAAIVIIVSDAGPEQRIVDDRLVLHGDVGDLGRQRENDMEIADRQQVGLALGKPGARGGALAFGTVAVAAAIVGKR